MASSSSSSSPSGRRVIWRARPFSSSSLFLQGSSFFLHLSSCHHGPERPSAQEMHMQVIHLLATVCIAINDQPVAALRDTLLSGKVARYDEHVADQGFIFVGNIIGGGNGFVRDNEYVHRGRGANIQERDHSRIAVQHGRR